MANLRRNGTITYTLGNYVAPGASYKVCAYPAGAIASGTNTGTSIPVFAGHGFSTGQYVMKGLNTTLVSRVASTSSTTIVLDDTIVSAANDVFINLGADTAPHPTFVQTSAAIPIYSTPDTTTEITTPAPAVVVCSADGEYGYYYPSDATIWELILDSAGTPVGYYITNTSTTLGTSGTPFVDNAITRWDGTGGLLLQSAYTSNTPTISDAGGITAAGTHTLGRTGATTTLAGALSVAEATTLTGVVTAPAANTLGFAGNTTTVAGSLAVTQNLSINGTTHTIAGTTLDVSATATTLLKTTTGQLNASTGTAPTVGTPTNFGSGGSLGAAITAGGTDNRFRLTVTAGSSGAGTNPGSVVVTFNGRFAATAPIAIVARKASGASTALSTGLDWTVVGGTGAPNTLTLYYRAASVANEVYVFDVIVLG